MQGRTGQNKTDLRKEDKTEWGRCNRRTMKQSKAGYEEDEYDQIKYNDTVEQDKADNNKAWKTRVEQNETDEADMNMVK